MAIILVSFADGLFKERAAYFLAEAKQMELFDAIYMFDWLTLEPTFQARHQQFIEDNKRGFGYWIWKPQVTLQAFDLAKPGDVIVYMDAGFELNHAAKYRFFEYIELARANAYQQLAFSNTHTEYRWTKQDLALKLGLNANAPEMLTTQLAAGFFILIHTPANKNLLQLWRDLAVDENYHFSDDTPSLAPNHPMFIEHRHDASIFSLVRKIHGTFVTHYEVQKYPHFDSIKCHLPAWASRKK